jgi:hypothetical protein
MRLTSGSIQSTDWSRRCRVVRRRDGRDPVSGGAVVSARELVDSCGGNGVSGFRLGEPGQSEREEEEMSASEGVEVAARCSISRLGSRRGGDGSAWSTRGDALLPGRHDGPVFELVTETVPPKTD